jgi:hypothetical protein
MTTILGMVTVQKHAVKYALHRIRRVDFSFRHTGINFSLLGKTQKKKPKIF